MRERTVKAMIVVMLLLAIAVYFVSGTYARYASTASGTGTARVAEWAVAVNGVDASAAAATFDLTFTEVENDNVVDGVIAPGSELYADFTINPEGSQVAMDYSFTLAATELSDQIKISRVCYMNGTTVGDEVAKTTENDVTTYTGSIDLASQTAALTEAEAQTVRVYITWTNDDAKNADDTALGVNPQDIVLTVNAKAEQHID